MLVNCRFCKSKTIGMICFAKRCEAYVISYRKNKWLPIIARNYSCLNGNLHNIILNPWDSKCASFNQTENISQKVVIFPDIHCTKHHLCHMGGGKDWEANSKFDRFSLNTLTSYLKENNYDEWENNFIRIYLKWREKIAKKLFGKQF